MADELRPFSREDLERFAAEEAAFDAAMARLPIGGPERHEWITRREQRTYLLWNRLLLTARSTDRGGANG